MRDENSLIFCAARLNSCQDPMFHIVAAGTKSKIDSGYETACARLSARIRGTSRSTAPSVAHFAARIQQYNVLTFSHHSFYRSMSSSKMNTVVELFYSCLALVVALRPRPPHRTLDRDANPGWRRFLNDLAWICDTKTGGESVVSLAVEDQSGDLVIWLASNSSGTRELRRLECTIKALRRVRGLHGKDLEKANSLLLADAVKQSHGKVKWYKRQLEIALDQPLADAGDENSEPTLSRYELGRN